MAGVSKVYVVNGTQEHIYGTSEHAAGYDIQIPHLTIKAGQRLAINLELALVMPDNVFAEIKVRSGFYGRGLRTEGVIDPDYMGPLTIYLHNVSQQEIEIDRAPVQAVFYYRPNIQLNYTTTPTGTTNTRPRQVPYYTSKVTDLDAVAPAQDM